MKLNKNNSHLIDIAVNNGFDFHHTKQSYIMLTKWLPKNEPNHLPSFSTHYINLQSWSEDIYGFILI